MINRSELMTRAWVEHRGRSLYASKSFSNALKVAWSEVKHELKLKEQAEAREQMTELEKLDERISHLEFSRSSLGKGYAEHMEFIDGLKKERAELVARSA